MTNIKNPKLLRKSNKSIILKKLYSSGAMSRASIADTCGFTKPAVSTLINAMLDEKTVVIKGKVTRSNPGRREVLVDINYNSFLAAGINIESDKIHFSLCRMDNVLKKLVCDTAILYAGDPIKIITEKLNTIIKGYEDKVLGVGIGVVGLVNENSGLVEMSYGLLKEKINLKEALQNYYNFPVVVLNNVRAQAKALIDENNTNFLYVKHSPGLGCAIVDKGSVLSGSDKQAGELGHTIVELDGELCRCGKKGCLEAYIAENRIVNYYYKKTSEVLEIGKIYSLYEQDDFVRLKLDDCIDKLALAVGNSSVIIDPLRIIVMGGIFNYDKLYQRFISKLKDLCIEKPVSRVEDDEKIKSIAGARMILKKHLFEV